MKDSQRRMAEALISISKVRKLRIAMLESPSEADMRDAQVVDFTIRLSELRKAIKQLSFNRSEFRDTDSVDILVSACIATFRAVGTEAEMPVVGLQPGTVRLPMKQLNDLLQIAASYKQREIELHFEPEMYRIEKTVRRHPDISLGIIPNRKIDLPVDAGDLDTLATAHFLSPEEIADQGLRERVQAAQASVSVAVARAFNALEYLGITRQQIQGLVDDSVRAASVNLKSVLHHHV